MNGKLSLKDEAYLCLLCLRNSTERIITLYICYIQLRSINGDFPSILMTMLMVLCLKQQGLQKKLAQSWPEYMVEKKWHSMEEQTARLSNLSEETQMELQQICNTEAQLLQLVYTMIKID